MFMMGIESTAHTFGVAVIDDEFNILSDVRRVYSPKKTLGIDPKEAAEHHSRVAADIVKKAMEKAGLAFSDLSGISYSMGPGMGPCLRIGATVSRFLSEYHDIPLYPVHHGLGHVEITAQLLGLDDPLVLLISGGHTAILGFSDGRWRVYGETLDITLGNLLDMFAREAGIPFPGGPKIESLASKGEKLIEMPYTIKGNNMVYSGLLTYAVDILNDHRLEDICYSLQETAFSILVEATERALVQLGKREIGVTGGVAANNYLFDMIKKMAEQHGVHVARLENRYNADNPVQIAVVGLLYAKSSYPPTPPENAFVKQRYRIEEVDVPWRR